MARGYDKKQEHIGAINLLGKDLARRAGRKCEWCETSGELRPYDMAPDDEPDLDALMLVCARCRAVLDGRDDDARTLRFLEGAVWSETAPVARTARVAIKRVDADWARDTVELFPAEE
jgi:hypothetical protein